MSHREKKKKKQVKVETRDVRFYDLRNAAYLNLPVARKLIQADPTIVAARNSIGETALHFLAVENQLEAVEFLAQHGSDLNNKNDFGASVLLEVARVGHGEMVELLVRLGARVDLAAIGEEMEENILSEEEQQELRRALEKYVRKVP